MQQPKLDPANPPKFSHGELVVTPGAWQLFPLDFIYGSLNRHLRGDWGDLCDEDKAENDRALKEGDRLLSSYKGEKGKLWVVTEHDRSVTTLLLPTEY